MRLLDTNIVRKLFVNDETVRKHLEAAEGTAYINGVVLNEILVSGYGAEIQKTLSLASKNDIGLIYSYMIEAINKLAAFDLLPYTTEAEAKYSELKKQLGVRIHKSDGRIVAHAVQLGFILVTENTADFSHIPGIRLENWARE